jgi:hypothetical protein
MAVPLTASLWCVGALFTGAALAIVIGRRRWAPFIVYGLSLAASLAALAAGLTRLLAGAGNEPALVLPLGLPWIGAHFRIDA